MTGNRKIHLEINNSDEHTFSILDAVISKEDNIYCALCLDLNVASEGETLDEAKRNLFEAVKDYIELAIENNIPVVRPVPISENPLYTEKENVIEIYKIKIDKNIEEYA